jgi:hypothetical protein
MEMNFEVICNFINGSIDVNDTELLRSTECYNEYLKFRLGGASEDYNTNIKKWLVYGDKGKKLKPNKNGMNKWDLHDLNNHLNWDSVDGDDEGKCYFRWRSFYMGIIKKVMFVEDEVSGNYNIGEGISIESGMDNVDIICRRYLVEDCKRGRIKRIKMDGVDLIVWWGKSRFLKKSGLRVLRDKIVGGYSEWEFQGEIYNKMNTKLYEVYGGYCVDGKDGWRGMCNGYKWWNKESNNGKWVMSEDYWDNGKYYQVGFRILGVIKN